MNASTKASGVEQNWNRRARLSYAGTVDSTDEQLMAAYVAGDMTAFRQLYARYATLLYRVLRRGLDSDAEAQDLLQQTFLQLHRARFDFNQRARLRPWLFTIALNLRREHYRRLRRRPEAPLQARIEPSSPAALIARFEAASTLAHALGQLEPGQREVIELFWLDQLSFQEVAEVMGISLSAAKVRAHRAYQRLRAFLDADPGNRPPDSA